MGNINCICLDGSLQNFGLAVFSINNGEIADLVKIKLNKTAPDKSKSRKSYDDLERFQSHWKFISDNIKEYDVKLAMGEVPSGAQDARAAFAFGGVTALYAALPVPFIPVYPLEVKEAAVGYKYADKDDIIKWAYNKWPNADWITGKKSNKMNITTPAGLYLTNANEHMADSCAIAMAGMKYYKSISGGK